MSPHQATRRTTLLLTLLAVLGVTALAGCASREQPATEQSPTPEQAAFPVTVQPKGAPEATIEQRPERIVSLSPSVTEVLYAVGAGEQVVAADEYSTYPEQAPDKKGLSGLTPAPEVIAGYTPDLVLVHFDTGGKLTKALHEVGVQTLVLPPADSLEMAYRQFELVGKITGHTGQATELAKRTRAEIEKLVADTPKPVRPLSYYHELDPNYYTATSATFIGDVYSQFGLTNIADGDNPNASGGYPQLAAERILAANPDLIFLADTKCCGQNAKAVSERPGWGTLNAVKKGNVFELDDDIASRWSPRIVDLARTVSDAVTEATRG